MGLASSKSCATQAIAPTDGSSGGPIATCRVDLQKAECTISNYDARWYGSQQGISGMCSPRDITPNILAPQEPLSGRDDELLGPYGVVSALDEIPRCSDAGSSMCPVRQPLPMLRSLSDPSISMGPTKKLTTKAQPAVPIPQLRRTSTKPCSSSSSEHWSCFNFSMSSVAASQLAAVRMAAAKTLPAAAGPETRVVPQSAAPATAALTVQQLSFGSDPLALHDLFLLMQQRSAQQQEQRHLQQQTLRMAAQLVPGIIIKGWKVEGGVAQPN